MKALYQSLIFVSLLVLIACVPTLTEKEVASIKSVGIVNKFHEFPYFTYAGTMIFQHEHQEVFDVSLKGFVTDQVASQLVSRGYTAHEIVGDETDSNFDLVVTIIPRKIPDMINSYGYGFYQNSILDVVRTETSYVALSLIPSIQGKVRCDFCYGQSVSDLPIQDMPVKWTELEDVEKVEFIAILKEDIAKAVSIAFNKTGL